MPRNVPSALDNLPEHMPYHDTGCSIHPACLTCPLPQCRYDSQPGWVGKGRRSIRHAEIASFHAQHPLPITAIAQHFGVNPRTVHRIVANARAQRAA